MKKFLTKGWLIGSGTFTVFLGGTMIASAQSLTNPLGSSASLTTVMNQIIGFLFTDVAIPLCTIMVLVGAFQMMTAAGDPEKFSRGKNTLVYAAIGFAVAIVASGLAALVKSILGQ